MINKQLKLIRGLFMIMFPLFLVSCNSENSSDSSSLSSITEQSLSDNSESSSSYDSEGSTSEPIIEKYQFQTIKGKFDYLDKGATSKGNALCLITNKFLTEGTVSSDVQSIGKQQTGLLFRSDVSATSYYCLYLESLYGNKLTLTKVNGTASSELSSCYISAGYNANSNVELKVIISGNKIQCFYDNKLFISFTEDKLLEGNRVGLISKNEGSNFRNIDINEGNDFKTVDTLITGHSYMELWSNYKSDLSRYSDIFNIGIGGTSANDWPSHINAVVDYCPNKIIYMIGINDVGWKKTPSKFIEEVKEYVNTLLDKLANVKICLISINNCPQYANSQATINEMNRLLWNYVYETDRLLYANIDKAFLNADGTPNASCFTDGLHPTASSYSVIRNAIYEAFDGKNQPNEFHDKGSDSNYDFDTGKGVVNSIKQNTTNSDWTFIDNKIITNSNGYCLSLESYSNFSTVLNFSNISQLNDGADNPFFTKKAVKAFLFGGSEINGTYNGYALHISCDWVEILKLDGFNSTFIDGFNVNAADLDIKLTINNKILTLTYGDGTALPASFNGNASVELNDYVSGKVGVLKNDNYKSEVYIFEFKTN